LACCGGSLDSPDATGIGGRADILGIGGAGGGAGLVGGGGAAGGGTTDVTWVTTQIHIAPTGAAASGLVLEVSDQAAAANTTLQFPPATHFGPTDGGLVGAHSVCDVEEVRIFSCAGQFRQDATAAAPGCLVVVLDQWGAMGEFIDPTGVRCRVNAASGIINLPPLFNTPPGEAATGTLVVECAASDGTTLQLQATFALPMDSWFSSLC
jgi:hypothetical protein